MEEDDDDDEIIIIIIIIIITLALIVIFQYTDLLPSSKPAVVRTHPLLHWVLDDIPRSSTVEVLPPSCAKVKEGIELYPYKPLWVFMTSYKVNVFSFTFISVWPG